MRLKAQSRNNQIPYTFNPGEMKSLPSSRSQSSQAQTGPMDVGFTDKTSQLAKIGNGRKAGFESRRFPSKS